jgi:hypothetical protein
MLLGAIGGPLLQGALTGTALGALTATQLGAGIAGLTSLAQGNDIVTAGLDAFGGYGGAGAIGNLAKTGAAAAGNVALEGASKIPGMGVADKILGSSAPAASLAPSTLQTAASSLPAPMGTFEAAGAGLKDLLSPGGATRFSDITGSSALTSVGLPAASLALQGGALATPQMGGGYSMDFVPFTPLSELRERNKSMGYAQGGIAALNPMLGVFDARNANREFGEQMGGYKKGGYLDGPGDGMSDSISATIEGKQPARLADGEFVIPADVVSHLGNGSTKAGAKRLYAMMDKVRKARTGTTKQGRQINPNKYMAA